VSYSYPGSTTSALDGIDLDLPAGSVVALLGENGAGKTTLINLMLGMYAPATGSILADGVDLRTLGLDRWRTRCSGSFQNYMKLEAELRESVGVGDLKHVADDSRIIDALRSGEAEDLITLFPEGLSANLGNSFEGGHELSGGQWQKIAISRSVMRDAPLLVVLDEPTASLDPASEAMVFQSYADRARSLASKHGTVVLLVSHRFTSARAADLIVVLESGMLREVGSHTDLIASRGLYAELYQMQALQYR
jgi:ATP-binding cassette subfamily B protein